MSDNVGNEAIRYRDGTMIMRELSDTDRVNLRRAGFQPFPLTLTSDDGRRQERTLWQQDAPTVGDYLNAAHILFLDAPGSLSW